MATTIEQAIIEQHHDSLMSELDNAEQQLNDAYYMRREMGEEGISMKALNASRKVYAQIEKQVIAFEKKHNL